MKAIIFFISASFLAIMKISLGNPVMEKVEKRLCYIKRTLFYILSRLVHKASILFKNNVHFGAKLVYTL